VVSQGSNASFRVSYTSYASLVHKYQWRFNGVDLLGATNATLSITNVQAVNEGAYSVQVYTTNTSLVTPPATLALRQPLTLLQSPSNQITGVGQPLKLEAAATGNMPMGFLWSRNGQLVSANSSMDGTNALSLAAVDTNAAGVYSLVITNGAFPSGIAMGTSVVVVVEGPATNKIQVAGGQPVNLSLAVASPTNLVPSIQWFFQGGLLEGATNNQLLISSVSASNTGSYMGVVTVTNLVYSNAPVTVSLVPANTVPVLISPGLWQSGQGLTLQLSGPVGRSFFIDSSSNLTNWNLFTNGTLSAGSAVVIVPPLAGSNHGFYRVRLGD
jgi:hypothetical protein